MNRSPALQMIEGARTDVDSLGVPPGDVTRGLVPVRWPCSGEFLRRFISSSSTPIRASRTNYRHRHQIKGSLHQYLSYSMRPSCR